MPYKSKIIDIFNMFLYYGIYCITILVALYILNTNVSFEKSFYFLCGTSIDNSNSIYGCFNKTDYIALPVFSILFILSSIISIRKKTNYLYIVLSIYIIFGSILAQTDSIFFSKRSFLSGFFYDGNDDRILFELAYHKGVLFHTPSYLFMLSLFIFLLVVHLFISNKLNLISQQCARRRTR